MGQAKNKRKGKHETPISALLDEEEVTPAAPTKRRSRNSGSKKKRPRPRKNRTVRRDRRPGGRH